MDSYIVEPASIEDAAELAPRLRTADRREVMASHGHRALAALQSSLERSDEAWAVRRDGELLSVFGVVRVALLGGVGSPWLLGSRSLVHHKRALLVLGREHVQGWRRNYDHLENWVDAGNALSIRWLRWLGFTLDPAAPYGRFGRPFHRFWMNCCDV
ncbi:MAG: hypothetical protein ACTS10_10975 [Kiloniellales bacterium]